MEDEENGVYKQKEKSEDKEENGEDEEYFDSSM